MRSDCSPADCENREGGVSLTRHSQQQTAVVLFLISNDMTCQLICTAPTLAKNIQETSFWASSVRLRFSLLSYLLINVSKNEMSHDTADISVTWAGTQKFSNSEEKVNSRKKKKTPQHI